MANTMTETKQNKMCFSAYNVLFTAIYHNDNAKKMMAGFSSNSKDSDQIVSGVHYLTHFFADIFIGNCFKKILNYTDMY